MVEVINSCRKNLSGQITLFLSMLLLIFVSLISTLFYTGVLSGQRAMAASISDLGLQSVLAQYNRKLLSRYELFYVDLPTFNDSLESGIKSMLNEAFEKNIKNDKKESLLKMALGYKNFIAIPKPEIGNIHYSLATDDRGKVFRQQAIDYMKLAIGPVILEGLMNKGNTAKDNLDLNNDMDSKSASLEDEYNKSYDALEEEYENENREDEEDGATTAINNFYLYQSNWTSGGTNPFSILWQLKNRAVLSMVWDKEVSDKKLEDIRPSNRELDKGEGIIRDLGYNGFQHKILFGEYILDKFGYATNVIKGNAMDYEIEYILSGKAKDSENLEAVSLKIVLLRWLPNYLTALTIPSITYECENAATAFAALIPFLAPLIPVLAEGFRFAISYGESVLDVRALLDGNKIAIVKTEKDWKLSLEALPKLLAGSFIKYKKEEGPQALGYDMYLRFLLQFGNEDLPMRALDLIEANMKQDIKGFQIDKCAEWIDVELDFLLNNHLSYRRQYGYIM